MPVAPATIVRTNRSWPGNVDERQRRPGGKRERRVAEVDRDPAGALLGQPVGVLPRERPDERRLAVVDMPGGADRQRHRQAWRIATAAASRPEDGAGDLVDLVRRQRARVQQEPAVAHDPHDRPARPGGAARRGSPRSRTRRSELGERERAAADPRDRLLDLAADERRRGARPAPARRRPARRASAGRGSRRGRARGPRGARASLRAPPASACPRGARAGADGAGAARRGRRGRRRSPPAARRGACRPRSRRGRRRPRRSPRRSARRRGREGSPSRGRRRAGARRSTRSGPAPVSGRTP